jgi:hypothetical protein
LFQVAEGRGGGGSPGMPRRPSSSALRPGSASPRLLPSGGGGSGDSGGGRLLSKDSQLALATFLAVLGPAAAQPAPTSSSLSAAAQGFVAASADHLSGANTLFRGGDTFGCAADELLRWLLCFAPEGRPSASQARRHRFFEEHQGALEPTPGAEAGAGAGSGGSSGGREDISCREDLGAAAFGHFGTPDGPFAGAFAGQVSQRHVRRELWDETNGPVGGPAP